LLDQHFGNALEILRGKLKVSGGFGIGPKFQEINGVFERRLGDRILSRNR